MPKPKMDQRELAQKSFMLGVDWLLKVLVESELGEIDETAAKLLRQRAQQVIGQAVSQ